MTYSNANFTPSLKGYSNVKPFRFWCQKVLPLVYDDSLSYYELLCKVVDYLNNVISDLSATEDNVGDLLTAYNQLQDYVNNYFTNLDVQEEINTKLDAMFEDGTIPTMIEEYVHPFIETLNKNYAELDTQINATMTTQNENIATLTTRVNNLVINNTTNLTGYNVVTVESTTAQGGKTVTENIPASAEILQVCYSGYNDTNDTIKSDNISYESTPNTPSSTQQQVVVTITDATDTRFNVFITYAVSQDIEIAELTDIRVGYDNTVYSSAGNAVRGQVGDLKNALNQVIEPFTVTNSGAGGVNVAYPMAIGESIIVTNQTPASVEVRQRNNEQTVIATTAVLSGTTAKITSTVDSTDIRFYFNQGGTIYFENGDTRLPVLEEKIDEINELKSVDTFLINQLIDGKLIFNRSDYNSDQLNTEVVVAEFDVDGVYDTVYVKADSISNVTNNYPIGVKEYDSNNTLVGITGRLQSTILNGVSIPITNSNTVKVKVYINVGTNSANSFKNLFIWRTKTGRLDNKPYPVFHVKKDGSGDYTSLVNAINEANRHMDAKVYVGPGTWDIIEELGTNYISNVGDTQRGLYLKNRVHLICDSRSKIVANYTGNLDNVKTWLSIFNSGEYGFTIENATLEGSNIRYLIHDERDQDTDAYTNKYINCTMVFDNRNNTAWSAKQCIGGGLGQNGYIDIEGCTFKSYQGYDGTVSYHNTGASSGRSHIVVKDCYFYLYNTFRLSWYGTSAEITDAVVTNCYLGADIVHRAESASATVENTAIVSWNNTINPHS